MIGELNSIADGAAWMNQAFEPMQINAFFLQWPDWSLHHAVLLRRVRHDEVRLEPVAADKFGLGVRREDQSIVAA